MVTSQQIPLHNSFVVRFLIDDRYRIVRHCSLLISVIAVLLFRHEVKMFAEPYRYYRLAFIFLPIVAMCYVNMYVLVPYFFFRNRYLTYLTLLISMVFLSLLLISVILASLFDQGQLLSNAPPYEQRGLYEGVIIVSPIIMVTTMIKLFQRWTMDTARLNELVHLTFSMELNALKNQVNPHFLFNMLNGIKALIRVDPEKAGVVIVKLSEILRYQLYENNGEKTFLNSEIAFLTNFLELEKIRRDNFSVQLNCVFTAEAPKTTLIAPNLFTTFLENAVKHSVNTMEDHSFVRASFRVDQTQLEMLCENSVDPLYKPQRDNKNSGIGLANIRRRLKLIYGESFSLEIQPEEYSFKVKLVLPL
ncbi:MAG: GHKL domain-containing protein [Chryseobacterium sp.]|nr:MAG: GHKL domain-containing protein [Chryseobacterium sp.]